MRGKARRRLEQAGEQRGLGQGHVAHRLAEIVLRGGFGPEGAAAHIGAVEIGLEDFVLAGARLQPKGEEGFLDLALDGAFVGQEQVLGKLLGQRRAALHHAAGAGIGGDGAEGADEVDAVVLVEAPVLGRQNRLDQVVGEFLQRHGIIVADAAPADLVAVAVLEDDGELGALAPVVGRLAEGGDGEHEQHDEAAGAERHALRGDFGTHPLPAVDLHPVGQVGEPLPAATDHPGEAEGPVVQSGVEVEEEALDGAAPPTAGLRVTQAGNPFGMNS
ncbi:MAG: penicillin-binding 1A family domain protein [Xanthobacteraceae bacterium]|nr:MAG: penicillin-binding 1A family domain protein [Xanthobacteraceae bacterium]